MQKNVLWRTFSTADQVAEAASEQILKTAEEAIAERGRFKLVLAGGTTPEKAYRLLAKAETDWSKWHIYYGDERCLPSDHPDRNSRMAAKAWLAQVPIPVAQIFTIPAELGPEAGALQYRQAVADALPFDLVLLGMGEDGHTASLFPGHVHNRDELTHAVYNSPKPPPERVSISAKALSDTRRLIFLVTGKSKQEPVRQWQGGADLPVAAIEPGCPVEIYIDSDALPG
ncbi:MULTISPECIES: 6-phosphogluconolactonase [Methylomicrobium]|uniref:6-phosphogluconolactonase n=1 Tax=Methylomicrobium album BG8 TaxID=686340 RepID=H8GJR0_METAL|nr:MULTISPECIES: 6-phosphogluconolactonase [Methylomicrobium]EIC31589.1 6-phosphogluconolactonase [Methylomicrobium album BG8]